jgi:hypothetical protein
VRSNPISLKRLVVITREFAQMGRRPMALEQEWQAFRRELPNLLANPDNVGKFALVHGDRVDSVWATMEAALDAGYERFGVEPFLVEHIVEKEKPRYFSRNIVPWQG